MRARKPPPPWVQNAIALLNGAVLAGVVLAAAGGVRPLLAPPERAWGLVLVVCYQTVGVAVTGVFVRDGVRAQESRVFWALFQIVGLFAVLGEPICDLHGFAVLPEARGLRVAGLVLAVLGGALRLGPMIQLGRRFTSVLTRLPEHRLETGGFYARVRHPSYLGMIILFLGLALTFRSALGLAMMPLLCGLLLWRMRTEERFLLAQFGDAYRSFAAGRARLLPGVY